MVSIFMQENFAHAVQVSNRIEDWHKRLGHASPHKLVHMAKEGLVGFTVSWKHKNAIL